jgi:hypothetical protein
VAFGIVRGMVVIGLAYLAFTYFVPIRQHPRWLAEARLLPAVQATSEVLLSLVPGQNSHVASVQPRSEAIRQAPAPDGQTRRHDPVADIIRRNAATEAPKPAAMQQQEARKDAKRYGAQDRQALDKLIEATGNGK